MLEIIKKILAEEGIEQVGMLKIDDCDVINQRILPEWAKSAILFSIPYRSTTACASDGFSEYARIYDYHNFSSELYKRTIEKMRDATGNRFQGFCDHSPINEKLAIAKCGLGYIGRNSLFIDGVYGSFVFIGSIITDAECVSNAHEIEGCCDCGRCINSCPNSAIGESGIDRFKCLSGISQKKSKADEEKSILKKHNIVWGCDICQLVCPYNKQSKVSPIDYFKNTRIEHIGKEFVLSLSEEEFKRYAFAYKGKKIVIDNIDFI